MFAITRRHFLSTSLGALSVSTLPAIEPIVRAARLASTMHLTPDEFSPDEFDEASPVGTITEWEVQAGTPGVIQLA